ncbi:MAG: hypothetical protein ACLRWH_05650 [Emergencia sp.]
MKTCLFLLRRDLMLIKMNMLKRIGILFGMSLAMSLLSGIQGQKWLLVDSLVGIEASTFQENPFSFPVGWMLISISGILISFDFVRMDFYEYSSNILVRVRKKHFWLSKMLAGAFLSLCLVLLYAFVYGVSGLLYAALNGEKLMEISQWCRICPYLFFSIFLGYCVFQLAALFFKEVVGAMVVLIGFTLGMGSDAYWFPVNHLMAVRSLEINPLGTATLLENLIFVGAVIAAAIFIGAISIDRIDVFSRKESD